MIRIWCTHSSFELSSRGESPVLTERSYLLRNRQPVLSTGGPALKGASPSGPLNAADQPQGLLGVLRSRHQLRR